MWIMNYLLEIGMVFMFLAGFVLVTAWFNHKRHQQAIREENELPEVRWKHRDPP